MNTDHDSKDLSPSQDRLTDALLTEHARLGKEPDKELVTNILLNTVNAPVEFSQYQRTARASLTRGEWTKVAAIVIGIVSIGAIALNYGPGPKVAKETHRQEETFHLVVKYVESDREKVGSRPVVQKVLLSEPGTARDLPVAVETFGGGINSIEIAETDLSAPSHEFGHSLDQLPTVSSVRSTFTLAANVTTPASRSNSVIYSGNVILSHRDFILKADSLVMEKSSETPMLKALNATLEHRDGNYKTTADSITFDPSSEELVAQGVTRLTRRGADQNLANDAAIVVFEGDDFLIEERFARPVLKKPGE